MGKQKKLRVGEELEILTDENDPKPERVDDPKDTPACGGLNELFFEKENSWFP